jgi:hypothetical protein
MVRGDQAEILWSAGDCFEARPSKLLEVSEPLGRFAVNR